MRRVIAAFVVASIVGSVAYLARAQGGGAPVAPGAAHSTEWRYYGGTPGSTKYSPLDQITRANASQLKVAWRWSSPDDAIAKTNAGVSPGGYEDTPLMANGTLYTITSLGLIVAIDPATGTTRWQFDPESWKAGRPTNLGFVHRGAAYWTDGTRERIVFGTHDGYLMSVDAATGRPDPGFGAGGRVDLTERLAFAQRVRNYAISSAPVIVRNVIIVGASISDGPVNKEAPRGDITGFDVRTGKRLWTFRSVPQPGEVGHDTWEGDAAEYTGNTNVWSLMSVDEELGYVYLPFGTPTNDYYGGHRPGSNLFAESLVCLDATTGKRVWHFQGVHHGLWDYDFPAAPNLIDITVNGARIPAVAQVSKQGFVYVFDRRNGTPVWPIEERPVPQSTAPGEKSWPTQPFPTRPPAFTLQGTTDDNLIDFTPEIKARAVAVLAPFERGPLFTPPTLKGTIQLPGNAGGANWSGAAFDPETGMLYVSTINSALMVQLAALEAGRGNLAYRRAGAAALPNLDGLPVVKPPYSSVVAYNMNEGTIAWRAVTNDGPRDHPLLQGLNVGPLGGGRPYLLATKSLLFVGSRGGRRGDGSPEPSTFQALDKATGALVHKTELTRAPSTPMTYLHNGKQYVAMAAGGGAQAEIVAFTVAP